MKVVVNNEKTKNKDFFYEENFWTGKRNLAYDNVPLTKIKRNVFEYKEGDKVEQFLIKGNQFIGVSVSMFGVQVEVIRKLTWLEIVLSVLVFIPSILFGAVGGAIGGVCGFTNILLLRKIENIWLQIIISGEFALLGLTLSYIFAILIFNAFTFI